MIDRLIELTLKDFRVLRRDRTITLDGDIVLIYGSNGAGKSSLLSAVELAITGNVPELARYGADFPRCLRHVRAEGITQVEVKRRDHDGQVRSSGCDIDLQSEIRHHGAILEESQRTLFSERCYLSQVRLSRLIDAYQATERGGADAPIVQFVKRLLAIESLESLCEALHDIEDVRRTRKAFPDVSFLEDEERKVALSKVDLAEEIKDLANKRKERASVLQALLAPFDQSTNLGEADPQAVTQLIERLTQQADALRANALVTVEQDLQRIRQLSILFQGDSTDARLEGLTEQLRLHEQSRQELSNKLQPTMDAVKSTLSKMNASITASQHSSFAGEWKQLELLIQTLTSQLQSTLDVRRDESAKKVAILSERTAKEAQLKEIQDTISQLAANVPQWAETLASIASVIVDEVCPVCRRDFTETHQGPLRDFVGQRAAQIGENANRLQDSETQRNKLLSELGDLGRTLATLSTREETGPSVIAIEADLSQIQKAVALLAAGNADLEAWIGASNRVLQLETEVKLFQTRINQMADARTALAEIAARMKISLAKGRSTVEGLRTVEQACVNMLESISKRITELGSLRDGLRDFANILRDVDKLDSKWLTLNQQINASGEARKSVDAVISKAKVVLKTAVAAKRKLLDRVFDETLNQLWTELFERLVRNELFKPRLSEARSTRDHIRATLQAVADGIETPFENVGAVQSLGNQNTSALSLFLALNLLEAPRHKVLILDDPVQSMDDVHVSQFAALVRELVNQADRQVFIAVHERALFEYLAFELGPTTRERQLVTIELERTNDADDCVERVERREWQPNTVNLEVAARAS